jgi:hypothetical protein
MVTNTSRHLTHVASVRPATTASYSMSLLRRTWITDSRRRNAAALFGLAHISLPVQRSEGKLPMEGPACVPRNHDERRFCEQYRQPAISGEVAAMMLNVRAEINRLFAVGEYGGARGAAGAVARRAVLLIPGHRRRAATDAPPVHVRGSERRNK